MVSLSIFLPLIAFATNLLVSATTIFHPPATYSIPRTLYARTLELADGTLLATWENYLPGKNHLPYFPIYQSVDRGSTWTPRSVVKDTQNGYGLRYQPFLYRLPYAIGAFPADTILLAGNSIPDDLSVTLIDIYASKDQGLTWQFVSNVAKGGRAVPNNGETPVWEPFLMAHKGSLIVYYSDQRDTKYGQKLVHQVTPDLVHFGSVVDDVTYPTPSFRPGMTSVSALGDGNYLLTYEFFGAAEGGFAVYYRIATDPLDFNNAKGHVIRSTKGTVPIGSPYNVWTPIGKGGATGGAGTIVVSCGSSSSVWVNYESAAPGSPWYEIATSEPASYTRSLLVEKDHKTVLIAGGGPLGGKNNVVSASTINVANI